MTWSPDLGAERVYRVLGAKGLVTPFRLERGGCFLELDGRVGGAVSLVLAAVVEVLAAKH